MRKVDTIQERIKKEVAAGGRTSTQPSPIPARPVSIASVPNNSNTSSGDVSVHEETYNHDTYDSVVEEVEEARGVYSDLDTRLDNINAIITKYAHLGVVDKTESTLAINNGTRTFTISPTDTDFEVAINGILQIKEEESIVFPNTVGVHFFYYDETGTLATGMVGWELNSQVPIAMIIWDGTEGLICEERHGAYRDTSMHKSIHNTLRTQYANGLAGTWDDTSFSIGVGTIYDEDLKHDIDTTTQARVFYLDGTTWKWTAKQSKYFIEVADVIQYNTSGTLADVNNNKFVAYWAFATGIVDNPVIYVSGQRTDNTIAEARTNNVPSSLGLSYLNSLEMKLLYRVIIKRNGTGENYQETADYRTSPGNPNTNYVAASHSSLTGLSQDDHTQYALREQDVVFTNVSVGSGSLKFGTVGAEDCTLTRNGSASVAFNCFLWAPAMYLESTTGTATMFFTNYNSIPSFILRRAQGTQGSPSAVTSGLLLGFMGSRGYGTNAFPSVSTAAVNFYANQNFTNANMGTRISFDTTPDNSTTRVERVRIKASGETSFGTHSVLWGTFGSEDVNLYRSSANVLKTDDAFIADTFQPLTSYKAIDGSAGVSGSFTTVDGKTITVKDGLITAIV